MPAKSQAQQKAAGAALSATRGETKKSDLRGAAKNALPRLHGALLKNEQDVHLFERLAFLARRQG